MSRPARTPIGPVAPPPMIGRMQQSGMMRYGEGQVPPAVNIAARVREAHGPQEQRRLASGPTAVPTKTSGMTRMGDMLSHLPADIAAMMQRPTSPTATRKKGRLK